MSRIERGSTLEYSNIVKAPDGKKFVLLPELPESEGGEAQDSIVGDVDELKYKEGEVDLVHLRFEELRPIQMLKYEEQLKCGRKIFAGQLSLKGLVVITESGLLTPRQQERVEVAIADKRAQFLLKHLDRKRDQAIHHLKNQDGNKASAGGDKELAQIIDRYLKRLGERLEIISQIDSAESREQLLEALIDRQIESVRRGIASHNVLVLTNWRLSLHLARTAKQSIGFDMPLIDLWDYGDEGLMIAAARFDYRKGLRFSTYASPWIKQTIARGIADSCSTIRLPTYVREGLRDLLRIQAQLTQEFGHEPDLEELAERYESPLKILTSAIKAQKTLSLNYPLSGEDGGDGDLEFGDVIPDESQDLEEAGFRAVQKEEVRKALASLAPRERRVIELRFGLEDGRSRTLEEVGREFHVTRERIRQIEARALRKLRHPSRSGKLRPYHETDPRAVKTTAAKAARYGEILWRRGPNRLPQPA